MFNTKVCAWMALGVAINAVADARPPGAIPNLGPPVGLTEDGSYPNLVELSRSNMGREVYMRTQEYYGRELPGFSVQPGRDKRTALIQLSFGNMPNGHALRVGYGFRYRLSQSEVVPIFDDLYLVETAARDLVRLKRVTDDVAPELRPSRGARSIPTNADTPRLFWDAKAEIQGRVTVLRIEPATTERAAYAQIQVQPFCDFFAVPAKRKWAKVTNTEPQDPGVFTVEVAAGDLLASGSQAYRVLKVVPEQRLNLPGARRARLVGWVEIDPEPVEPKPEN